MTDIIYNGIKHGPYESFKKGSTVSFNKDTFEFTIDGKTYTACQAVSFANMVIDMLTDKDTMFIERHMKPELIDKYNDKLNELLQKEDN